MIRAGDVVGELFEIQNNAGDVLEFNQRIYMPVYSNFGAPRIEYQTRRGYKQDGSTPLDLVLSDRRLSIQLYHEKVPDRSDWWDLRRSLIDFF